MRSTAALFFAAIFPAAAQTVPLSLKVPSKMDFAGITLIIREDARREIQKDVDALTQSPRHYNIKVERARTYFPIIERIFREEDVPDDFKYLVLQESALIADAVSVSDAVGFWQFKDFTAAEMGLRVDDVVDERMNIVASTRAAARYLKKNNSYFDNWLYALQAYQMGAGGVMKTLNASPAGMKRMEITGKTYWYVKKYLAHKIAYEGAVNGRGQVQVVEFETDRYRSLAALARDVSVDEEELKNYNKWARTGMIPDDKPYTVVIPVSSDRWSKELLALRTTKPRTQITARPLVKPVKRKINGVYAIQAMAGEDAKALAQRAGVDPDKFVKWNDLSPGQALEEGEFYFLSRKRVRAEEAFHKLQPGENLWSVSQKYGVQLRKLRKYNRLRSGEPAAGTMLWLASMRPKDDEKNIVVAHAVQVDTDETFNWSVHSVQSLTPVPPTEPASPTERAFPVQGNSATVLEKEEASSDLLENLTDSSKILQETNTEAPDTENVTLVPTETSQKSPGMGEHTVKAGETLYSIANRYNVGVMDLVKWNQLSLSESLRPGQVLRFFPPQGASEPVRSENTREVYHHVKPSDTLYSIARQYGVTIKELMEWNNKKDFSLSVGERLKVIQVH